MGSFFPAVHDRSEHGLFHSFQQNRAAVEDGENRYQDDGGKRRI
jgi:hypothetical protein